MVSCLFCATIGCMAPEHVLLSASDRDSASFAGQATAARLWQPSTPPASMAITGYYRPPYKPRTSAHAALAALEFTHAAITGALGFADLAPAGHRQQARAAALALPHRHPRGPALLPPYRGQGRSRPEELPAMTDDAAAGPPHEGHRDKADATTAESVLDQAKSYQAAADAHTTIRACRSEEDHYVLWC